MLVTKKYVTVIICLVIAIVLIGAKKKSVDYDRCFQIFSFRKDGIANPGSGFFVQGNTGYYLITAKHVLIEKENAADTAVNFKWPAVWNSRTKIQVRNRHNKILFEQPLLTPDGQQLLHHFHYDSTIDGVPDISVIKFHRLTDEIKKHSYNLTDLYDQTDVAGKINAYGLGYPGRKIRIDSLNKKIFIAVDTFGMQVYRREGFYKNVLFTYDHSQEGKGMSGGPIINQKTGKIIGVIAGDSLGTYAHYAKQIINWLDKQ